MKHWGVSLLLLLCACPPSAPAEEADVLLVNATLCRMKGNSVIAGRGSCEEKRERLAELVAYDADCIGLFRDAGPVITCPDGGAR